MVNFQRKERYGWEDLLTIMHLLRAPGGCPWDREQTHQSIRRNFLEETYEALDAIDRDDVPGMKEELGDVLLQVVFHAVMEEERGRFTPDDVVDGIAQKLVFRHAHVFGTAQASDSAQALEGWEAQKKLEKGYTSPADAVEASAKAFNDCAAAQTADAFGRTPAAAQSEEGPFYALQMHIRYYASLGGLHINDNMQVLNTKQEAIPGLYAAGEVTGGVHGANRLGGNAVADIVVFGRIAAQNAAAYIAK